MDKTVIKFDDTDEKYKFHKRKSPISIDINEIVVSNNVSFGKKDFKYFIDYKDTKQIRASCIFLPKMSA